MSKKEQLEIPGGTMISTVVTRSQSSRASFRTGGLDVESQPRAGSSTVQKQATKKEGSRHKGSKINMGLFGDVDLEGGSSNGSSSETGKDEVSSVGSHLHVSLDDVIKKKAEREKAKGGSKASSKVGSMGSMTKSELVRINLEIKKLELEDKKGEREFENKKGERESENKKGEREFELKKLELLEKEEKSRVKDKVDIEVEKPKFESSLSHDKITVNTTTTRAEVPRMYEDNFNLDNYLVVFERLAVAQGWSRDKWVSRLTSQFNAKCQDIFSRIPVESCQEYDKVKLKLLEGYNLGPESYRKTFKQMDRIPNDNFKDFAVKIEEVFSKWLKGVDCNSFDQLKQILLLEKFYSSIPKELVALLKDKNLTKLEEAGKLADQFDSYREKIFSNQGTAFARESGTSKNFTHHSSNNRESRFDKLPASMQLASQDSRNVFGNKNSNKFGGGNNYKNNRSSSYNSYYNRKPWHDTNDNSRSTKHRRFDNRDQKNAASLNYPNKSFNSFKPRVNFVKNDPPHLRSVSQGNSCRFCKRPGHQVDQCRTIKRYCDHCQKNGHDTQYCYKKLTPYNAFISKNDTIQELFGREVMQAAKVNGISVRCLRDTGSSISLIKKDLIPNLEMLKEFTVCTTAFNSKHTIQMAIIDIVTKEGSGRQKVGVVEDLLVDLILGNDIKNLEANTAEFCAAITRSRAKQLESECNSNVNEPKIQTVQPLARSKPIFEGNLETVMEGDEEQAIITPTELVENARDLFKFESLKGATRQEFIDEQQNDPSLARIRKAVGILNNNVHKERTNATHYYMRNKLIFRKFYFGPIGKLGQESSVKQLVVPIKYRRSILSMGHDEPLASHLGVSKTKSIILKRFFWPGVFRDIFQYITSCEKCQLICKKVKKQRAPLVIMPTAARAWEKIIFDIVGPLEKSKKGNQYILVVIDVHSHYPEAFPLRAIDSKHIANELMKLFTRVGIPKLLQHDQATNFVSKMMLQLYTLLGINHISSSCYHPETNALVERLNGTIKKLLKTCLVGRDTRTWDEILPLVLFAIRASKHESTGFSPFELMYGYQIRGPLDIIRELWVEEDKEGEPVDLHQYVLDLRTTMRELAKQAVEREETTKKAVKDRYDKKAELVDFEVGEKVFLLLPQKVSSLSPSWVGPYVIQQKLGPVSYRVLLHDRVKKLRVVHTNMLRKYTPRIVCFISNQEGEEFEADTPASFPESAQRTATSENVKINERLNHYQLKTIKTLVKQFDDIFSDLPGSTDVLRHQIRTINNEPINCVPYTVPQALIPIAKREIDVALQLGIIEPVVNEINPTAYASPTILVKKKGVNNYRLVIDHRRLNLVTIPQRYSIPNASHLIEKVSNAKFLSLTDLTKGYNQVRVCDEDVHKTGFTCLGKHYVCRYLSFGLSGGPATFQLLMDTVLAGMEAYTASFIDDICVFSNSFEEHITHLENVFMALRKAHLTAQPTKVQLAMTELKFLGHIVGGGKRAVDSDKINVLENIKTPRSKKEVRSFLGFVGFYRTFIKSFSEIAAPLTDLLKKTSNELVPWTEAANKAFHELKGALQKAPILVAPDFNKHMYVLVDSSMIAVGGVLCHKERDQLHPILFIGRKFNPTETRLSATERELLGILSVLNKLKYYLLGRKFTLLTDVRGLIFLKESVSKSAKLTRWSLMLNEYDFSIGHVPGKLFTVPDYLSRYVEFAEANSTPETPVNKM